jgi:hypothetical protein
MIGHASCEAGHFVCDSCHRSAGVDYILGYCLDSDLNDPIEILIDIMRYQAIYPNGPEHHTLVGAALLTAYQNSGGDIDLSVALGELQKRSLDVPGGTCGFWGCCGAAISAGMYMSIISGSTPMTREPWALSTRLTALILEELARVGGPRCCKRTSFTSVLIAAKYTEEYLGVRMSSPEETICTFSARNAECIGKRCPYKVA